MIRRTRAAPAFAEEVTHRTTDAIKAALPKKTTCCVDHRFVTFHGLNVTRPTLFFRLHPKSICLIEFERNLF